MALREEGGEVKMKKIDIELNVKILNEDDKMVGNIKKAYTTGDYDDEYDFMTILTMLRMVIPMHWAKMSEEEKEKINKMFE